MKNCTHTLANLLIALIVILFGNSAHARNIRDTIGSGSPIHFTENKGQWENNIVFRSVMRSATLFVENDCFTFVIKDPHSTIHHPRMKSETAGLKQHAYRLTFENSTTTYIEGLDRQSYYENYYLGNDPSRWASEVGVYTSVLYHEIYPNTDLKVYTASNAMKYDFILNPGANVSDICMAYSGVDGVKLQNGNIIIKTSVSDIVELRPYAYQIVDGQEVEIAAHFILKDNKVTFAVGRYDNNIPLIIDPYLYFSTYTGSTSDNWGTTACYDSYKNTYTSGVVFGTGYPVSLGVYDGTYNLNCDIGIFKFDTTGTTRIYATYLGGRWADMPHSMFVNSLDELVIFGTTGSYNFPTTSSAFDDTFNGGPSFNYESTNDTTIAFPNGSDIFISRFNSSGTQLQASTFVGGSGNDGLNYRGSFSYNTIMLGNDSLYYNYGDGARGELITDDMNNIYVGSTSTSLNFPVTPGCIQPYNHGGQDGVVFKIDYNLSNMLWATYLGGGKDDAIYSIDCDNNYNVVVCGGTNSTSFPVTNSSYCTTYNGGSADGFVAKISYYGTSLMASTFFGSSAYDQSYFVRCGKQDDVFIFGQTKATGSTLVHNANYNVPNSGQFLARFKPNLDTLVWSTVFGTGNGEPNISPTAFAVDICNRIFLSGWGRIFCGYYLNGQTQPWNTSGTTGLPVTQNAHQSLTDGQDFYIMAIDIDANNLVYGSFFGEPHSSGGNSNGNDHVDGGTSRFDRLGTLYQSVCASCGGCDNFPTTIGVWGPHNNSNNCNNAIFRINLADDFPVAEFVIPPSGCAPQTISFHNTGRGDSYLWDFGDGSTSTATNPTHTFQAPGTYTVTLIAYMPGGCKEADTTSRKIMVLGQGLYELDTLTTCPGISIQIGLPPAIGCTYYWFLGSVSDQTVSNPYISLPGRYGLIVSNGICSDTIYQTILVGEAAFTLAGDTVSCSLPTVINAIASGTHLQYHWSTRPDFSDTLGGSLSNPTLRYYPDTTSTVYLHVTDDLGCEKSDSIHIRFYKVVDSLIVRDPLCPYSCDGYAQIVTTPLATQPYYLNWGSGWCNDTIINTLCGGSYSVTFSDVNGCTVSLPFSMNNPAAPGISDSVTNVGCLETCTGSAFINVSGSSTYTYLWLDDSSTAPQRQNLCVGTYIVQITDSSGCIYFDTIEISENGDMAIELSYGANSCSDECSGSATAIVTGGTLPYSYMWNSGEQTQQAHSLCEGLAIVVVTDSLGCNVTDSIHITMQHSFDSIDVWADQYTVFRGNGTTLHVTPVANSSTSWSPSALMDNPTSNNPFVVLLDSTTFYVTLTDSIGCEYTDSIRIACVNVNCGEPNIFIPNVFTPNEDGKNDRLCFSGEWIETFSISIFTRWGECVYRTDDITQCWDGRYKDQMCMPGVYVYHCRVTCSDGQETLLKGDITLIR